MNKAIIFGAGSIGRGFLGQIFFQSGLEIIFIDIDKKIVNEVNSKKEYPLYIISSAQTKEVIIKNVRAINIENKVAVIQEIANADIAATAVGASALPAIAEVIASGAVERFKNDGALLLNILICENLMDASGVMRDLVRPNLSGRESLLDRIGFVETSIGRMVPIMTEDMHQGNILSVWVEPYCELPVDAEGFVGKIPDIRGMVPFAPFQFYKEKKLYIHNLGHSVASYMGHLAGYKYIWECVADKAITKPTREAMLSAAAALAKSYDFPEEKLNKFIEELIIRFNNKKLKDTVRRGCRDPLRKLKPSDRFIGALNKCKEEKVDAESIRKAIASVLLYESAGDKESIRMKEIINKKGVITFLQEYCLLNKEDAKRCNQYYKQFINLNK